MMRKVAMWGTVIHAGQPQDWIGEIDSTKLFIWNLNVLLFAPIT